MIDRKKLAQAVASMEQRQLPKIAAEAIVLAAAKEHLATLPKTKTIDVWYIEAARREGGKWYPTVMTYTAEDKALTDAEVFRGLRNTKLVAVTGPHQREVPDDTPDNG